MALQMLNSVIVVSYAQVTGNPEVGRIKVDSREQSRGLVNLLVERDYGEQGSPNQGAGILSQRQIEKLFCGCNLFDSGAELIQVLL
jgi:hypothetical protein